MSADDDGAGAESGPVTVLATPIRLDYDFTPGSPSRGSCVGLARQVHGAALPGVPQGLRALARVLPDRRRADHRGRRAGQLGTVTTYCVVNVPFAGQSIEIPYICAQILLDGANLSFMGLLQEIPTDQIRMGMRVEAVWVEPDRARARRSPRSSTSGRTASRTPTTRPTRSTCERARPSVRPVVGRLVRPDPQCAPRRRAQRGRDAHAGDRRGVRQHRHHQGRRRLHLLGLDRLPDRWAVQLRDGARRGRGLAASGREPRGDGRGVGALRGVGPAPGGSRSTPHWSTPSAARRWATSTRSSRSSSIPTTSPRSGPIRSASPHSRPVPSSTRARAARRSSPPSPPAAASPRWPIPRPRWPRTCRPRRCWPTTTWSRRSGATPCPRSPTGRRPSCWRPGTRPARWAEEPGVDHRHRPSDRDPLARRP